MQGTADRYQCSRLSVLTIYYIGSTDSEGHYYKSLHKEESIEGV